jgi:hypothetical protein
MIKSGKKLTDLATILSDKDSVTICETIASLRDEQPFEGAIGLLTTLYDETDDLLIRKAIEAFMNDLRDQSVITEVIAELRKKWDSHTMGMLVSSCWQSSLDYSGYSPDFAKIFIESDYMTAIECLTVIEESVHKLSPEIIDEIISILGPNPFPPASEKRSLYNELLIILGQ